MLRCYMRFYAQRALYAVTYAMRYAMPRLCYHADILRYFRVHIAYFHVAAFAILMPLYKVIMRAGVMFARCEARRACHRCRLSCRC